MNQETRTYYIVMERPVGHGIWTYAAMACERHAAESKAITICTLRNTCTQVVTFELPKEPDVAEAYAAIEPLDNTNLTYLIMQCHARTRRMHGLRDELETTKEELDAANEELLKQLEKYDALLDEAQKIRVERDEARELFRTAMELGQQYKDERDEARNLANAAMWESDRLRSRVGNLTQASRSLASEPNSLGNL